MTKTPSRADAASWLPGLALAVTGVLLIILGRILRGH